MTFQPLATAEQIRAVDKAEVLPSLGTLHKALQRLTDRLIAQMF